MNYAASRLAAVRLSSSARVSKAAKAARAAGEDVIDLGLGEPDFDTPAHIVEAAHEAALAGQTRYPPIDGAAQLKSAVVDKFSVDNGLEYTPSEVIVSNGAKQVIFSAMMATLNDGDEVLLCAPYFEPYKDIVLLLGGSPKVLTCPQEHQFRLTPQALDAAITPKTRWLFLNQPSNPTGAVYADDDLRSIGEVLARHPQVLVLSDEIYEHILFDNRTFLSFAAACPELKDRILTVNGVSKTYAMTGWRIGYGAGPQPLVAAMTKVQSQINSGVCSVAQAAATAALTGPQDEVWRFRAAFERRRNLVVERITAIDGLTLHPPGGAFYAFIGCKALMGTKTSDGTALDDDVQFSNLLLDEAKIAAVPGSAYELSPFFRISTATSDELLERAMDRLADWVATLKA
jgi:aspartate aminotransferase